MYLPYMDMAAVLFKGTIPFAQTVNTPSTEGLMVNLMKIGRSVAEMKTFKDYTILYMYLAKGQGQITPGGYMCMLGGGGGGREGGGGGRNFVCNWNVLLF